MSIISSERYPMESENVVPAVEVLPSPCPASPREAAVHRKRGEMKDSI